MNRKKIDSDGLSFIEIIVVISIIAILAALILPRISHYFNQAKVTREISNARLLAGEIATHNAVAKMDGTDTIPKILPTTGTVEVTSTMLISTSLELSGSYAFPDSTIVRILVNSEGNVMLDYE